MLTDERYKRLMEQVGMPNSRSLLQALKQAAMEGALVGRAEINKSEGKMDGLTVSRETAEKLQAAGWKKETKNVHVLYAKQWMLAPWMYRDTFEGWLPAPTIGEFKGEVIFDDLREFWCRRIAEIPYKTHKSQALWHAFAVWLYATLTDVEKMVEVWLWREGKI